MPHHSIILTAQARPELIERVLRVIRHRGFHLDQLQVAMVETSYQLKLDLLSERSIHLLIPQLQKLIDVRSCELLPAQGVPIYA